MVLEFSGVKADPDLLAKSVFTEKAKGSYQQDMLSGARRSGRIPYSVKNPDEMISELNQKRPVLVFLNLGLSWHPVWHYAVVTGVDGQSREIIMHSGQDKNLRMGMTTFDHVWARAGYWGFVLLKPGEIPEDAEPLRFLEAVSAFEAGNADQAAISYETAVNRWPQNREVSLALGNSLLSRKKYSEAADVFRHLTEEFPDYGDAWNNLAEAFRASGLMRDAVWAAENAVKTGGRNLNVYQETLRSLQTP